MKTFWLAVVLGILFCLSTHLVIAQTVPQQPIGFRAVCLGIQRCVKDKNNPNWVDPHCSVVSPHRSKIVQGDAKLVPNSKTYVAECITYFDATGKSKYVCTTASSTLDKEAFCGDSNSAACAPYDFYTQLNQAIQYTIDPQQVIQFKNISEEEIKDQTIYNYGIDIIGDGKGPATLQSDSNGNIPALEWQSFTARAHDRRFIALNLITQPVGSTSPTPTGTIPVSTGTQGQTTFSFDPTVLSQVPTEACDSVTYDPDGIVFDAQTLEPIPNAKVTLLKNVNGQFQDAGETEYGIVNPYTTFANGQFSFIVSDGIYKLSVQAPSYVFPLTDVSKVNVGYSSLYSNMYPLISGEQIVQKGTMQRRDIPLLASNGTGNQYPIKIISLFQDLNKETGSLILQGALSHPLTKIMAYTIKPDPVNIGKFIKDQLVTTYQADADGRFSINLDQQKLPPGTMFGFIEFQKNLPNGLTDTTTIQNDTLSLDPIPNYLEGYAMDINKNVLPNATIAIMTAYSAIPYYQVKADSTGYFKISSEYLPFSPYNLRFTSATGATFIVSPETFITDNATTLSNKHIDLYSYKNSKGLTKPPKQTFVGEKVGGSPPVSTASASQFQSQVVTIILILLLLFGMCGGILGIYLLKRHAPPPQL